MFAVFRSFPARKNSSFNARAVRFSIFFRTTTFSRRRFTVIARASYKPTPAPTTAVLRRFLIFFRCAPNEILRVRRERVKRVYRLRNKRTNRDCNIIDAIMTKNNLRNDNNIL